MGSVRKGLIEEIVIGLLHGGVFVREAHRVVPVDLVERFTALAGKLHSFLERLTAAAGAAAGTGHDLHEVVLRASGADVLHNGAGIRKAATHARTGTPPIVAEISLRPSVPRTA